MRIHCIVSVTMIITVIIMCVQSDIAAVPGELGAEAGAAVGGGEIGEAVAVGTEVLFDIGEIALLQSAQARMQCSSCTLYMAFQTVADTASLSRPSSTCQWTLRMLDFSLVEQQECQSDAGMVSGKGVGQLRFFKKVNSAVVFAALVHKKLCCVTCGSNSGPWSCWQFPAPQ